MSSSRERARYQGREGARAGRKGRDVQVSRFVHRSLTFWRATAKGSHHIEHLDGLLAAVVVDTSEW